MNSALVNLIIGGVVASVVAWVTAITVRKRTVAETSNLDAGSADVLSQAAARLIPLYDSWLKAMEIRLTKAEEGTAIAMAREASCLARLNEMQLQIDELRRQVRGVVIDGTP